MNYKTPNLCISDMLISVLCAITVLNQVKTLIIEIKIRNKIVFCRTTKFNSFI